ncbi:hypothetical protein MTR67_038602 [Solanum verrucosum]|uniref:Uncharacterized protein n=1 Tax=Solanum verrucosum TaxID=315347 RepID=A0AAF0UFR6_SOLVR|nr:hypothetical protein MTR67_038602 [Solanum verrucosum]
MDSVEKLRKEFDYWKRSVYFFQKHNYYESKWKASYHMLVYSFMLSYSRFENALSKIIYVHRSLWVMKLSPVGNAVPYIFKDLENMTQNFSQSQCLIDTMYDGLFADHECNIAIKTWDFFVPQLPFYVDHPARICVNVLGSTISSLLLSLVVSVVFGVSFLVVFMVLKTRGISRILQVEKLKANIYIFGIQLVELIGNSYIGIEKKMAIHHGILKELEGEKRSIVNESILQDNDELANRITDLAVKCLNEDPNERPDMKEVAANLFNLVGAT